MATLHGESPIDNSSAKPPLTEHRLFPAIVALWFAALLGLGGAIILPGLLESLLGAGSPIGTATRLLIGLAGCALGAWLGLKIASKVAGSNLQSPNLFSLKSRLLGDKPAAEDRRPISAHDELGGEGLVSAAARRSSLAMAEPPAPSKYLPPTPLPEEIAETAAEPAVAELPVAELPVAEPAVEVDEALHEELTMPESPNQIAPESLLDSETAAPQDEAVEVKTEVETLDEAELEAQIEAEPAVCEAVEEPAKEPLERQIFGATPTVKVDTESFAPAWQDNNLEDLGLLQLVQRLGSSLERRREFVAQQAALKALADEEATAKPLPGLPQPVSAAISDDFGVAEADEAANAMAAYFSKPQRAQSPAAQVAEAAVPEAAVPEIAGAEVQAAEVKTPELEARVTQAPSSEPKAPFFPIYELDAEDEEDDAFDLAASFALPLVAASRETPAPQPAVRFRTTDTADLELDEEAEEESDLPDEAYGSILSLRGPLAGHDASDSEPEFVRIEEATQPHSAAEQSVTFPGQEKEQPQAREANIGENQLSRPDLDLLNDERALREALRNLQRMSGAA